MNRKILRVFIYLVIWGVVFGGNIGCTGSSSKSEDYEWITMDEYYEPKNFVEEFIKNESEIKGLFPVYIRNYGKNASVLRRFKGSNFARPTEAQLNMMYRGLDDWMLIDLKYKTEKDREIQRTILYVSINGTWKVGDSGELL